MGSSSVVDSMYAPAQPSSATGSLLQKAETPGDSSTFTTTGQDRPRREDATALAHLVLASPMSSLTVTVAGSSGADAGERGQRGIPILPLPLPELVNIFLDALSNLSPDTPDTPVLYLKSIKASLASSSSSLRDSHHNILAALPSFILAPPTRQAALHLLLFIISHTTPEILQPHLSRLLSPLSRILSPTARPPSSPLGVATSLRAVHALLVRVTAEDAKKALGANKTVVSDLVAALGVWCYFQPNAGGSTGPAPASRAGVAGATGFAGGVLGGFGAVGGIGSARSLTRTAGRSIFRGHVEVSSGMSSESESDSASRFTGPTHTDIRLLSVRTLHTLASISSTLLHPHWDLFLSNSPYARTRRTLLSLVEVETSHAVRLRSARALEAMLRGSKAFLSLASDRPTKASFTSLSSKLAGTVSDLHRRLGALLSSKLQPREVQLALLKLARTLVEESPYHRLVHENGVAEGLMKGLLANCGGDDATMVRLVLQATKQLIESVWSSAASIPSVPSQAFDLRAVVDAISSILESAPSDEATRKLAWSTLVSCVTKQPELDISKALATISVHPPESSSALQSTQLSLLALTSTPAPPILPFISSRHPQIRAQYCPFLPVNSLLEALDDPHPDVVAAACRSIGLEVKSEFSDARDASQLAHIMRKLVQVLETSRREVGGERDVVAEASWALANCLDAVTGLSELNSEEKDALADLGMWLLQDEETGEKTAVNGLRIVGSVLKLDGEYVGKGKVEMAVHLICQRLVDEGLAKVRWNAAASLSSFLASPVLPQRHPQLTSTILAAIASTLDSTDNYKIRIQLCLTLLVLPRGIVTTNTQDVKKVVASAREALDGLGAVTGKEKEHADTLREKLRDCIQNLGVLM